MDQLELAPQPFGGIILPACVSPSLGAMRPQPSDDPSIQLMEALSDVGAAVVIAPAAEAFKELKHLRDEDHATMQGLKAANDNLSLQLKAANDYVEQLRVAVKVLLVKAAH
jgi:hypothetical protein